MRYFDASALVKRYVRESGSTRVRRLLSSGSSATSRFSAVEIASALARRAREGAFSTDACARAMASVDADMRAVLVIELTTEIVARAQQLVQRHALRAGDAVQLASCLFLRDTVDRDVALMAYADRLNSAARREGVRLAGERRARTALRVGP
jgi:predicted nucleic acid-binding protein